MNIKDVITELKIPDGPRTPARKKAVGALAQRIQRYGIKTICMLCGHEGRHKPGEGRLRESRCGGCGYRFLRPVWWVKKYATKAHAEWKENAQLRFLL